jgi:3-methyladenine DNA glycosylase AlkD
MDVAAACAFASDRLGAIADTNKALGMAAYLKTDMPFYGVYKAGRTPILRELVRGWVPADRAEYTDLVSALWDLPHREEQYLALGVARAHASFITPSSLPLYRRLVVSGAWWDLVDEAAIKLIGGVLFTHRPGTTPKVRTLLTHTNLWLRRTALICQVGHKASTDTDLLFDGCSALAHESDFFIRKAIGWALRDYAWTNPEAVRQYVTDHEPDLSPLSRREALKNIT